MTPSQYHQDISYRYEDIGQNLDRDFFASLPEPEKNNPSLSLEDRIPLIERDREISPEHNQEINNNTSREDMQPLR